ncbi:MGH1-like glycoside hydrolase domain-containing protein [Stratiformator vulcanicus]|uniref:Mannosyl oligosaccharide glucosidase n=1 Tax=Stratiformator vulcanicus TaxID=2527980 RepID=A0A517QZP1_9PLAN|nr:glucosidase [Stratiformator vulcanicus]QDT37112.1 Mannosyl oligosaccharide glucosidase [Stratiformator vulcanicus]
MSEYLPPNPETERLAAELARKPDSNWKRWGPYLSERQWGTVREDYSPDGTCWEYFPHDHARSRAYRWGEDGILGITDRECRLCFGLSMWNGQDPILKERLFGLNGHEGNHGEDVKECYYYLESTPTHSYMKGLYKYPQAEFPYGKIVDGNRSRSRSELEYELLDTGIFDDDRYFDITVEYAKGADNDILIRIHVANRAPVAATLHLLPTLWFRNTWSWGCDHEGCWAKPRIWCDGRDYLITDHEALERFHFYSGPDHLGRKPRWLFAENETNFNQLYGSKSLTPYSKDSFHRYLVKGEKTAIRRGRVGTKVAPYYKLRLKKRSEMTIELRLSMESQAPEVPFGEDFNSIFETRRRECDQFYRDKYGADVDPEEEAVLRQAYAGLLWTKQFYHYVVKHWLDGDPAQPPVAEHRRSGRNADWTHLFNRDVISMPDKWEYPWYAAWDSAFHMIPFAGLDPNFAKEQLILFLREWYMHPNGQIPAYEFAFSDVNPPVHGWAVWRVYQMTKAEDQKDRKFLIRCFQKLLLNFTWWVNRKDPKGHNLFAGGFLGLDNIGVFDRSKPLPEGGYLQQADGTAWMAFYCANMLSMAFELASANNAHADIASKFFEHYIAIANAMNSLNGDGLWDEEDGFYYDKLNANGVAVPLKIRSIVGLIPLLTVDLLEDDVLDKLPNFRKRMDWFLRNKTDQLADITFMEKETPDAEDCGLRLLAVPTRDRLERILAYMLDEDEFLSPYGIRSLSKFHEKNPFSCRLGGEEHRVSYVPGESDTWMFGGNSNWRGPIWFPINFLIIEALQKYHRFYGDSLKVECPTGSGNLMNLEEVAREIEQRLLGLFLPDENGRRPCHGDDARYADDPHWRELILFYEYFDGDTGRGCGASHQTGWTALSAFMLEHLLRSRSSAAVAAG